jgi:hypothetical protein
MFPAEQLWHSFTGFISFTIYWTAMILVFSYTTVYFLVPVFFKKEKYFLFFLGLFVLLSFLYLILLVQNYFGIYETFNNIAGVNKHRIDFFAGSVRLLGNPPLVCGLLLSLKSIKTWHLKQEEKETLIRENTRAELQLLKAQVHPHFLFNTLNNIYSYSLNRSMKAAELVQKLRSMLEYMVTECDQPLVPLKDELKMIHDYLGLEKIRYGNRLSMQVEIKNHGTPGFIAPLLMIPFVENGFKHGTSQTLEHPWIRLKIYTEGDTLHFLLNNSKPSVSPQRNPKSGIGLHNVEKRLELIYPNKHFLQIETDEDQFSVHMRMPIQSNLHAMDDKILYDTLPSNQKSRYASS